METPFIYGKLADSYDFTDRDKEALQLEQNFRSLVNSIIISPRRWGKTSLVNRVANILKEDKDYYVAQVDIFNCRTPEQFFTTFANAVISSSASRLEEFVATARKYLGLLSPKVSLSEGGQQIELTLGIDIKGNNFSIDEILELPNKIATERGKKFIVCIDEFQSIGSYEDSIGIQRQLRSHWQKHTNVAYCLYGSKRHMLLDIFTNYEMPFYQFGNIMFLEKIQLDEWKRFIVRRFDESGKKIDSEDAGYIAQRVKCHPYYVQQLSQQAWLRTNDMCSQTIIDEAFDGIVSQLSLIFSNLIDSLTARQIGFLQSIGNNEKQLYSSSILSKYGLGTSANIKNLKKSLQDRDLIDILPGNEINIQDPIFEYWLMNVY